MSLSFLWVSRLHWHEAHTDVIVPARETRFVVSSRLS
jgi:hypothetical protein